ncbi:hypothetical protein BC6307_21395 [Sutcliffiella cohnii]|uniref:ATP-grasp domain-containing protein n=1 Tax=Sutcliffiella cohnii TaxID=33932 RepID=A0A223KVZ7_9BACI|nr:ATP-grasp domain-containing protein [Sutcliffiella cohnii]AST93636.1 hypothetical protein BC6307_21395 [Sutcliffiella cohnii]
MSVIAITDSETRKSLAVTRAFGKLGHEVINISSHRLNLSGVSKFSTRSIYINQYEEEVLLKIIEENNVDILITCEEETMELVIKSKKISQVVECINPNMESFNVCRDKYLTMQHALNNKVRIPKTYMAKSIDALNNYMDNLKDEDFPIVIKPRKSSGSRGIKICKNIDDYYSSISSIYSNYGLPMVQEYIPPGGDAIGASFLYYHGKEVCHFVHRRIREYPVSGGPSTLCESIILPEAVKYGRELLKELNWHGVAMVEYKKDPRDGELVLMEINPRIWGSIQLPIYCGINIPEAIAENYKNKEYKSYKKEYKEGVKLRWFFPADILSILTSSESLLKKLKNIIVPIKGEVTGMIYDPEDIKPSFLYLYSIFIKTVSIKQLKKNLFR